MLYNRNIKWKSDFDIICNKLMKRDYRFTDHLLERAINGDEKHRIPVNMLHYIIREVLRTNTIKPFEVEEINGYVNKFCVRVSFDDKMDITIVFGVGSVLNVRTAWLNRKGDKHSTLIEEKYAC